MTRANVKPWRKVSLVIITMAVVAGACWQMYPTSRVLGRTHHADGSFSIDLVSAPYRLDRVYLSMTGPRSNQPRIRLSESDPLDETLWLTGVEVEVVAADDLSPVSNDYFCHSNLTLNPETTSPEKHNGSFSVPTHADWRLFTLVPGRMSEKLPSGFGLPVKNATLLDNFTMALNQNPGQPDQRIRLRTRIWYRRGSDAQGLRPLFRRSLYVYQQHLPTRDASGQPDAPGGHLGEQCAESCRSDQKGINPSSFVSLNQKLYAEHPGATCCVENASPEGIVAQFGQENTAHWMVPPGRHVYRSEVTPQLNLPFDTTVHYVTGHLHPFGRSLKLIEMDSGETVFEIRAESLADRLGVQTVSEISSRKGEPIHTDRRYELVTEYVNTTDRPIDAMAILYLYAADEPPLVADRQAAH